MAEKKSVSKEEIPAFDVHLLIERAKDVFGVEKEVAAGAFYGVETPLTKEKASKLIEAFLKKEVVE
jgi:hypothetical protein